MTFFINFLWLFWMKNTCKEASCGAAVRSVTVKSTGCGFDPHSRRWIIYLNLCFHFFALVSRLSAAVSSASQYAMPPEFGKKRGTECLNTRFPLPTLLCAGYSVKLIKKNTYKWMNILLMFVKYGVFEIAPMTYMLYVTKLLFDLLPYTNIKFKFQSDHLLC